MFKDRMESEYGLPSTAPGLVKVGNDELIIIARHGSPPSIPPNMIDHRANIGALLMEDVEGVISICSTGALRRDIKVPSIWVPEDYLDLYSGATIFRSGIHHITPKLDHRLRSALVRASWNVDLDVNDGGIYVQTRGPRLETKAEIRMLSRFGDLVGMSLGSECTISCEMGLPLAGITTVDNYANGIGEEELDFNDILASASGKWDMVRELLVETVKILGKPIVE